LTCTWQEAPTVGYQIVLSSTKPFPFTLPVFRLYDLAQSGSGVDSIIHDCGYSDVETLSPTSVRDNTLIDSSSNVQTLPRTFGRKGCG
jgi:hypothetical protein